MSDTRPGGYEGKEEKKMSKYMVRLCSGFAILDGEFFTCSCVSEAIRLYRERCARLGITIAEYDYFTVHKDGLLVFCGVI